MLKKFMTIIILTLITSFGCSKSDDKTDDDAQQIVSNPQYAAQLLCYIGKIGSGSNCSMVIYDPNKPKNEHIKVSNHSMQCGTQGQVSDISWKFIEHNENNDIYSFTRLFPADTNGQTSTTKIIEYNSKQTIIFEDEYQVIVLDTPK